MAVISAVAVKLPVVGSKSSADDNDSLCPPAYLASMGRYEESYTELQRAIRLDPHSSIIHTILGYVYLVSRRYEQAIAPFAKTIELDATVAQAHFYLGLAYMYKSMYEPALAAMQKGFQLAHSSSFLLTWLGEAYAAAGYTDEDQIIIGQLKENSKIIYITPYFMERIYAPSGHKVIILH